MAENFENISSDQIEKKEEHPVILESVMAGDMVYGRGELVRDEEGYIAQVADFRMVKDETNYGPQDRSIRKPKVQQNPEFTLSYADGTEKESKKAPKALYKEGRRLSITENDPFFDLTYLDIRGHRYQIGEMVSFGHQIGTITAINPDKQTVAIWAREIFGKETPYHLYQIGIDEIDYIERVDGDIRMKIDKTGVYKPTLEPDTQ